MITALQNQSSSDFSFDTEKSFFLHPSEIIHLISGVDIYCLVKSIVSEL